MSVDIKSIGAELRGSASPEEADATIHARKESEDASLTLSVDPEGEVDMTYYVRMDQGAVTIHGGEAIVQRSSGDIRYYRLDEMASSRGPAGDLTLIQGARAALDREFDSISGIDGFVRYNPFEDDLGE